MNGITQWEAKEIIREKNARIEALTAKLEEADALLELQNRDISRLRGGGARSHPQSACPRLGEHMGWGRPLPFYRPRRTGGEAIIKHADDCGWHVDQYPWECTCGAIPRKAAMDELIADSADELWAKHEREHLFDRIEALTAENERLLEAMKDPNVVHVNMLRGGIAKPSVGQILHIYGEDVFRAALGESHD